MEIYATEEKQEYMPLLLLADEQQSMVEKYLAAGTMYVLADEGEVRAECVVMDAGNGILEIMNIAVAPAWQGRGYGKKLIEYVENRYRASYDWLQVGTGDSPLTIPFYEHCGFVRHHVRKNFFVENYDHPIVECGHRLIDMIVLRKKLRPY